MILLYMIYSFIYNHIYIYNYIIYIYIYIFVFIIIILDFCVQLGMQAASLYKSAFHPVFPQMNLGETEVKHWPPVDGPNLFVEAC